MSLEGDDLREVIDDFIKESAEMIEQLDQDLVALEEKSGDANLLNRIFRNLHTIKGTANFFTAEPVFASMARVAHAAEDVMGFLRSGKMSLSPAIMDAILEAVDAVKTLISQASQPSPPISDSSPLVAKLRGFLEDPPPSSPARPEAAGTPSPAVPPVPEAPSPQNETRTPPTLEAQPQPATAPAPSVPGRPAPAKPTALASMSEEDRQELLQDFLEESREIVEKIDSHLLKLEKQPQDPPRIDDLFRCVHTLKGTSAFLGFEDISQLAHTVEDILKEVRRSAIAISPQLLDSILQVADSWKRFFQGRNQKVSRQGHLYDAEAHKAECGALRAKLEQFVPPPLDIPKPAVVPDTADAPPVKREKEEVFSSVGKTRKVEARPEQNIRVDANRLDKLMNLGGELVLGRNRLGEVVRSALEKLGDDKLGHELVAAVDFINFVIADMQMAVLKTRMQPIGKIFNRFNRTVRDLARELGKEVNLFIEGADTELDKSIIDELGDPLTHLLRNAVDHGIEMPDVRRQQGKSRAGSITLCAIQEGNQIVIELRDDGRGMDMGAIQRKAVSQGLVSAAEAERLSPLQITEFVFLPGFSTADKVSSVSGRGVGMDVVKTNIERLNGSVEISSEAGKGCAFKLRFPLTLATIQVLQVKVHAELFAIPLASVIETLRIYPHQVQSVSGKPVISFRNAVIPLVHLDEVFEMEARARGQREKIYVVLAGIADKKIGIMVDQIIRREEIVIKSLGKLLQNIPGISGACIGGDGRVILILDIAGLMRILPRSTLMAGVPDVKKGQGKIRDGHPPCILIVEDSRSERKRTRLLMEAKGFQVIEAGDGKDALSKLGEIHADMVITDIEMPELDGYQLTAKIREHRQYRNIPVIAVSSHKEMVDRIKGMESGIDAYLPKPFQEEDLLKTIKSFL